MGGRLSGSAVCGMPAVGAACRIAAVVVVEGASFAGGGAVARAAVAALTGIGRSANAKSSLCQQVSRPRGPAPGYFPIYAPASPLPRLASEQGRAVGAGVRLGVRFGADRAILT